MNKTLRKTVHDKCKGKCAYCGESLGKRWTVDHVISQRNFKFHILNQHKVPSFLSHLTENDVNHVDNLLPACQSCNNYKDTMDLETFRTEIARMHEKLMRGSTQYRIAIRYKLVKKMHNSIKFYFEKIKLYG